MVLIAPALLYLGGRAFTDQELDRWGMENTEGAKKNLAADERRYTQIFFCFRS